jgi:hypothetical protein
MEHYGRTSWETMTSTIKVIALTHYLLVMESFVQTIYGSKINNLQGKNLRVVTGNVSIRRIPIFDVA